MRATAMAYPAPVVRVPGSTCRNWSVPAIVVEAAASLFADPAGLHVFHEERAGAVFGVREAFVQNLHDRQAGVEPDEVGEFERPHRMVGAEFHRRVDRL